MTMPTNETTEAVEAVALIIEEALRRHGVRDDRIEGTVDDALAALAAARLVLFGESSAPRYRHKVRGTEYTLIGTGRVQGELSDEDKVVIYQGDDGYLWVRGIEEFHDGRFEAIRTAIRTAGSKADG